MSTEYEPLELDSKDLDLFHSVLNALEDVSDDQNFWETIGARGGDLLYKRLTQTKEDPNTALPWTELTDEWKERKAKGWTDEPGSSGGILKWRGDTINSAQNDWTATASGVTWGSIHDHSRWIEGTKNMVDRHWLGFDARDIDELIDTAKVYMSNKVKHASN